LYVPGLILSPSSLTKEKQDPRLKDSEGKTFRVGWFSLGGVPILPNFAKSFMQPRIYVYKVTFEEIPDWYWGVHKEQKYGEIYLGSPVTHAWKWEFYTPHLQICELFPYTDEGWEQARKVEDSCILPYLNNPLCLNEHVGGSMSLKASSRGGKNLHKDKDDLGRSVVGVKRMERLHKEKDDLGKSVKGVKAAERLHKEKDCLGRSVNSVKGATACHKEKNEFGKSVNAVKGAEKLHKEKDEFGRSVISMKGAITTALKRSKKVLVTFPDGSQRLFNSITGTGRFLGVTGASIHYRIKHGAPKRKTKLSAYQFEFA
jgi:hypothetical protein